MTHKPRRYTLAEILASCDFSKPEPPEYREWERAPLVGRERDFLDQPFPDFEQTPPQPAPPEDQPK